MHRMPFNDCEPPATTKQNCWLALPEHHLTATKAAGPLPLPVVRPPHVNPMQTRILPPLQGNTTASRWTSCTLPFGHLTLPASPYEGWKVSTARPQARPLGGADRQWGRHLGQGQPRVCVCGGGVERHGTGVSEALKQGGVAL